MSLYINSSGFDEEEGLSPINAMVKEELAMTPEQTALIDSKR